MEGRSPYKHFYPGKSKTCERNIRVRESETKDFQTRHAILISHINACDFLTRVKLKTFDPGQTLHINTPLINNITQHDLIKKTRQESGQSEFDVAPLRGGGGRNGVMEVHNAFSKNDMHYLYLLKS